MSSNQESLATSRPPRTISGDHHAPRRILFCLAFAGFVAGLLPGLSLGDILVTKEGERIETKGPWKIKGRQVLFTSPSGTLSAVRLSEIDLEASELATHPPSPPPPPPPPAPVEKPEPVMVLTNDNVGQAEEIQDFASAFGGVFMDMQRAMADGFAEFSDDPEAARDEIDEQLDAQGEAIQETMQEIGEGMAEMVEVVTQVTDKYPGLKELDANDPKSVREHAADIRAAAADMRAASREVKTDTAREMLSDAADQMEAKLRDP